MTEFESCGARNVRSGGADVNVSCSFVSVVAEGYPFPTNLDKRVPETAGMAPSSEQDILKQALKDGASKEHVLDQLRKMREDSKA